MTHYSLDHPSDLFTLDCTLENLTSCELYVRPFVNNGDY